MDDLDGESAGGPHAQAHHGREEGDAEARRHGPRRGPLGGRAADERRQADSHQRGGRGRDLCHDQAGGEIVRREQRGDHAASSCGGWTGRINAGGRLPRVPAYQSAERATAGRNDDST